MSNLFSNDEILEKKVLFYNLYKIYYKKNLYKLKYKNIPIILRDRLIDNNYKVIPEIIYVNKKPVIKYLTNTSFMQKLIYHLTYFYLDENNLNDKELLIILRGDIEFLNISFSLLRDSKNIRILEYKIIYEILENISNCLNIMSRKWKKLFI